MGGGSRYVAAQSRSSAVRALGQGHQSPEGVRCGDGCAAVQRTDARFSARALRQVDDRDGKPGPAEGADELQRHPADGCPGRSCGEHRRGLQGRAPAPLRRLLGFAGGHRAGAPDEE